MRGAKPSTGGRRGAAVTALASVGVVLALVAGCALPSNGDSRPVADRDVPYALLSPSPAASAEAGGGNRSRSTEPHTYLVDEQDRLVAVPSPVPVSQLEDTQTQLMVLMKVLGAGPSEPQRAESLSTALTPGVGIEVVGVHDGIADLQVRAAVKEPSADRLPIAIGQIVLTATTVPGVAAVQLVRDGTPIQVPLPGGELSSAPLHRSDYRQLLPGGAAAAQATQASVASPTPTG